MKALERVRGVKNGKHQVLKAVERQVAQWIIKQRPYIHKMMKEIKNEMIRKDLFKIVITEAIDEEMDRVRQEIQTWKEAELESLVSSTIKVVQ